MRKWVSGSLPSIGQEFAAARCHPQESGTRFSAQYWASEPGESSQRRGGIIHMRKWASGSLPSIGRGNPARVRGGEEEASSTRV
jgi:hypothetical protein